jgi:hypothetical protein
VLPYKRLLDRINDSIRNLPSHTLSLGKQKISFGIGIVFGIASLFIGAGSLIVALKVKDSAVKVDKMDSLLKTIADQDTTLVRISKQNSESIVKLDSILKELYHQFDAVTTNTEPKIKLENPIAIKINDRFIELNINYTNTGQRDADNLFIECYKLYDFQTEFDISLVKNKHESIIITPQENALYAMTLGFTDPENLNKLKYRIRFTYLDKFKNMHHTQTFYLFLVWKELTVTEIDFCTTPYERLIDKAIAAFKKTGNPKQPYKTP